MSSGFDFLMGHQASWAVNHQSSNKVAHSFAWERRIPKPLYPRADHGPDHLSLACASFMKEEELKHCPHDAVLVTIGKGLNLMGTPGKEAT